MMEIGRKWTREENYQEYLRLTADPNYTDVTFDEQSGGVSAVHKEHCFDKQMGPFGCRRGQYEKNVIRVLRENGDRIILQSEDSSKGSYDRISDGILNGLTAEIKSVEGIGQWLIKAKLRSAAKQGAECVIIYFPVASLYSHARITEGLRLFSGDPDSSNLQGTIQIVVVIVENRIMEKKVKTTRVAEWFLKEFWFEATGGLPLYLSPLILPPAKIVNGNEYPTGSAKRMVLFLHSGLDPESVAS